MRALAFLLLTSAAVDWPTWLVDRAGVALLGLAWLALALPSRPRKIRRFAMPSMPAKVVELEERDAEPAMTVADRIAEYLSPTERPT
jgi:hypothetical protein